MRYLGNKFYGVDTAGAIWSSANGLSWSGEGMPSGLPAGARFRDVFG
jgi:hypothetical protein